MKSYPQESERGQETECLSLPEVPLKTIQESHPRYKDSRVYSTEATPS